MSQNVFVFACEGNQFAYCLGIVQALKNKDIEPDHVFFSGFGFIPALVSSNLSEDSVKDALNILGESTLFDFCSLDFQPVMTCVAASGSRKLFQHASVFDSKSGTVPLYTVATKLQDKPVLFNKDEVDSETWVKSIVASSSTVPLYAPIDINGVQYHDGNLTAFGTGSGFEQFLQRLGPGDGFNFYIFAPYSNKTAITKFIYLQLRNLLPKGFDMGSTVLKPPLKSMIELGFIGSTITAFNIKFGRMETWNPILGFKDQFFLRGVDDATLVLELRHKTPIGL